MNNNQLMPFMFGDEALRAFADENGDYWFVAKDVCRILEISKYRDAIQELDDDEKGSPVIVDTPGGPQKVATISESGLYALVFRSRKPEAKRFSKWVRSEVLPALRKSGRYEMGGAKMGIPEEALKLKPSLRERTWRLAMQTAQLDCGNSAEAMRHFEFLCRLFSASPPVAAGMAGADELVADFIDDCCVYARGAREKSSVLYREFCEWAREHKKGFLSHKTFGMCMGNHAERRFSNGKWYEGISLIR